MFEEGEPVTTSPITSDAVGGTVVQTKSGSKYFLEAGSEASAGGFFGFGSGSSGEAKTAANKAAEAQALADEKKKQAEEKRAAAQAAAEAKRQATEARKAAAAKAAEERARAAEERKLAAEAAAKAKQEKLEAQNAEKQAAAAALAEAKRKEAERKKKAAAAEQVTKQAKPGVTINLFGLGGGDEVPSESARPTRSLPKVSKAPRGVPTIVDWRKRRDGGISGRVIGSPDFDDGDRIETSPIVAGTVENENLVQTGSGNRYFLSSASVPKGKTNEQAKAAQAAAQATKQARPGATISLFGLGGGGTQSVDTEPPQKPAPQKPAAAKRAPRGVPSMVKWRQNRDGSITGFISGSPNFSEGERITTSPIASGNVGPGEVVRTGSGSSYFLV